MQTKYIVYKLYMDNLDGYMMSNGKHHDFTNDKKYATKFTLKQASKIVFDANKEFIKNYSYYVRYGYEESK